MYVTRCPMVILSWVKYGMTKLKNKKTATRTHSHVKPPLNNPEVKGQRRIGIINVRDAPSYVDTHKVSQC
mgnify:CR=1 FL=1